MSSEMTEPSDVSGGRMGGMAPVELRRLRLTLDRFGTEVLLVGDRFEEGGRLVQAYMDYAGATWLDYDEAYDRLTEEWHREFGP